MQETQVLVTYKNFNNGVFSDSRVVCVNTELFRGLKNKWRSE
jgi:hypothetical protein